MSQVREVALETMVAVFGCDTSDAQVLHGHATAAKEHKL